MDEHDRNLEHVLNRERPTQHGVKPDVEKLKAINDYAKPSNKQDEQRLLGMVNFVANFAPQVSEVTAPLRELIKKNISSHWSDINDKAFSDLKSILIDSQALRYYDVTKPVTLQVDASQHGLGAASIQDNGPVAYASKALNET